ncbi:MAG: uroporphyrinogen-III C-methyltransferase [Thermodesulfobacteriota bacterium]
MTRNNKESRNPNAGTVFLVGAGPGDPSLITVKGLECIRTADVIVYDYLASPRLIQEAREDAELIYVGKKGKDHTCEQDEINDILVRKAREGKKIVRLKGGDPYVFGRGAEEAEQLVAAGIPFEVVPGVTSAVAAPAYAGIPVTHREHASMVTFITGHEDPTKEETAIEWEVLARNPGTLVFLMGVRNLSTISDSLIKHGKDADTPAALIRWGTTSAQESVFSTLARISQEASRAGIKPPAVLVVGTVTSLHEKLNWFEQKPLFGKRILITRSRKQSRGLAEKIASLGGEPILFPTIEIKPPKDTGPMDKAIQEIASYDWIIFTSVNGVELFLKRFLELRGDIRDLAGPRIGAIGPVTATTIGSHGIKVDLLAKEFVAESLLAQLTADQVEGKRFLIPRAETAREVLREEIAKMGGTVDVVPVYRTCLPDASDIDHAKELLRTKAIHVVTFTSSSTVNHFVEMLGSEDLDRLLEDVVIASIGPITSQTIREKGLTPTVEAAEYTTDGLVAGLAGVFLKRRG